MHPACGSLVLFCCCLAPHLVRAAVIAVPADVGTIAAALALCAAGDTVRVAPGDYHEQDLLIDRSLTLMGENPQEPLVRLTGTSLQIQGVTDVGRGVLLQGLEFHLTSLALNILDTPTVEVSHCQFVLAIWNSTGVQVDPESGLLMQDCAFIGLPSGNYISALGCQGEATLLHCDFTGFNPTSQYPSIIHHTSQTSPLRLFDCTFHDNGTSDSSFQQMSQSSIRSYRAPVEIVDCRFLRNHQGVQLQHMGDEATQFQVRGCTFSDNDLTSVLDGSALLEDCRLDGNQCWSSLLEGQQLSLQHCVIQGNRQAPRGYDLFNAEMLRADEQVELLSCSVIDNRGFLILVSGTDCRLERTLFALNQCLDLVDARTESLTCSCENHLWNSCGDWAGPLAVHEGQNGNHSLPPRVVNLETGDLRPALGSPLRPELNPCGQLVGALDPVELPALPLAQFEASLPGGAAPLSVSYHARDEETADSYSWDFTGDGLPDAQGSEATWTFAERGWHSVSLTTVNAAGSTQHEEAEALIVGGALFRVPEQFSLQEALALALPADTLDLACGSHVVQTETMVLPSGVVLRGREPGTTCARLVLSGTESMLVRSPLPTVLKDVEVEQVSSTYAILRLQQAELELDHCRLLPGVVVELLWGSLLVSDCTVDSLGLNVLGYRGELQLTNCRLLGNRLHMTETWRRIGIRHCELTRVSDWTNWSVPVVADELELESCTLLDCGPGLLQRSSMKHLRLDRCLVIGGSSTLFTSTTVPALDSLEVRNTDIWGLPGSNWNGRLAPWAGVAGNLEADPFLCDPEVGDLHLARNSPCLLDSSAGEWIGVLPAGCESSRPWIRASSSVSSGAAPLALEFRSSNMGEISSLEWDVDDDGVLDGTQAILPWTFTVPGVYQPVLRVAGPGGSAELRLPVVRVGGRLIRVPEDYASVREALEEAVASDTVQVGCGVWQETNLHLQAGVWLKGSGTADSLCTVLDGGGVGRILTMDPNLGTRIEGMVFRNGVAEWGGAAIEVANSDSVAQVASVANCEFRNNEGDAGGALSQRFGSLPAPLRIQRCRFENNQGSFGGALFLSRGSVSGCTFRHNLARRGGALYIAGASSIDSSSFQENRAEEVGAAIMGNGSLVVSHCTFYGDSTQAGDAVLHFVSDEDDSHTILSCIISGARSGCSLVDGSAPQIRCSDFWGNADGDWPTLIANQLGQNGNLQMDPRFCSPISGNISLEPDSPCRPEQSACGWMGAIFTSCDESALPLPADGPSHFALHPAVPNPFNLRTTLRFQLDRPGRATLTLHNLLGQQVAVLLDGEFAAGEHQHVLEADGLASGLYLLKLEAGPHSAVRKLTLLK